MIEKLQADVYKRFYKFLRPSSYPYLSGDGFRQLANHIYDDHNRNLQSGKVNAGDTIFVATHYLKDFFKNIDPQINCKYKLITHNSDDNVDEDLILLATDKIEVWFAQNLSCSHYKVVPLPIGLENLHHYHRGRVDYFNKLLKLNIAAKKNKMVFGFNIQTNPLERTAAYHFAVNYENAVELPENLNQIDYLQTLMLYKFVLSPPGNGLDAHRTWESMYLGVIPIVKDSAAMRSFESLGLPLWVVNDWNELLLADETFLSAKYEQLKSRFNAPALFIDYWRQTINCHNK
jgi:hypothetical protein